MADFDKAILILLRDEGGYAPNDNNRGAVNFGVTQATLTGFWKTEPDRCLALGLPKTVEAFTSGDASRLYRAFFWDRLYLGAVNDDQVAGILFGLAVNQGPGWALRHAKAALLTVGLSGKTTREVMVALNSLAQRDAVIAIFNSALGRYQSLAEQNPALYGDDLKGWELRLRKLCGIT